ncbi:lysoplasmalogenase [Paenibacillus sp. MBLB4367]|uniref:lysoplasmalogenase n=1 Tax=Paenibacillus sp. MBLB4367 TaxID=3384767 RepID=UPI003907F4A5
MFRKILIGAILVSGIGYLLAMAADHTLLRWLLKPGTIVLMIALAATTRQTFGAYRYLIMAGLACSAVGDSFLLMEGASWFTYGVAVFMAAHLVYMAAFLTRGSVSPFRLLALLPIAAYSVWLLSGLREGMVAGGNTGMWVPITVYVIVISLMIWCAVFSGNRFAVIGAILFFLSDSLLAWNKFVSPIEGAGYAVMITYYLAQFMIAMSLAKSPSRSEAFKALAG